MSKEGTQIGNMDPLNSCGYSHDEENTQIIFTMLKERKEWKYEDRALTEKKFSNLEGAELSG